MAQTTTSSSASGTAVSCERHWREPHLQWGLYHDTLPQALWTAGSDTGAFLQNNTYTCGTVSLSDNTAKCFIQCCSRKVYSLRKALCLDNDLCNYTGVSLPWLRLTLATVALGKITKLSRQITALSGSH